MDVKYLKPYMSRTDRRIIRSQKLIDSLKMRNRKLAKELKEANKILNKFKRIINDFNNNTK
jgi:hypothetical protein